MLNLEEFRSTYPQYNDMTDYELSTALHRTHYADMPYEQFARGFGGPMKEDERILQAREYNARHPEARIEPREIGQGGYLNDLGHAFAAGLNDLASLPFWAGEKGAETLGWDTAANLARSAKDYFKESADAKREGYSADMKLAQDKQFVTEDAEGNITGFGNAWTDPRAVSGMIAESLPSMAGGMGIGAGIAKGLIARGMSRGLAWGIGSSIGEGSVAGAQDSQSVYDAVMKMPEETLARSPEYQELLRGMSPEEARKKLADSVAFGTALQTGFATGVLSAPAGALFGRMLGGETGKTLLRSIGKQGVAEGLEETAQSGAEQYLQQNQLQRADQSINPSSGVANAAVAGGLAGMFMGGGMAVPGHMLGRRRAAESAVNADANATEQDAKQQSPTIPPVATQPGEFNALTGPEWNPAEPRMDEAAWNREAAARGWRHLRTDAHAATAPQAVSASGMAASLERGESINLLQADDAAAPAQRQWAAQTPWESPFAAPFPDASSFTMETMLNPAVMHALPVPRGVLNQLGAQAKFSPAATAGPVNVSPVPTQARITNTQTAPRADTTAQADALGMPAPAAVPREARATQTPPVINAAPVQPASVQAAPVQPVMPHPQTVQAPLMPPAALEETQGELQGDSQGTFAPERMQSLLVKKSRQELLNMLPQEKRAAMRKKKNPDIMAAVREDRGLAPDGASVVTGYGPYGQLTKRGDVWTTDRGVALADVWEEDEKGKKKKISRAAVEYTSGMAEDLWYAENVEGRRMSEPVKNVRADTSAADPLGTAHTEFSGKPAEAIEHLMRVKEGHVPAAFHKKGLGDIDLPWGKGGKKGYGLAHIIERRNAQNVDGAAFVRQLPSIIGNGEVVDDARFPDRRYVKNDNAKAVIRLDLDGEKRSWLVTAYMDTKSIGAMDGLRTTNVHTYDDERFLPSSNSDGENQPSEALPGRRTLGKTFGSEKTPSQNSEDVENSISAPSVESKPVVEPAPESVKKASVSEQRAAILAQLPEDARKKAKGYGPARLKAMQAQQQEKIPRADNSEEKPFAAASEAGVGVVESEKTAQEQKHGRNTLRRSAKQRVVDEQVDLAPGLQSGPDKGDVEQPEPRKAAERSGRGGHPRPESLQNAGRYAGGRQAGNDRGSDMPVGDGLPGRGHARRDARGNSELGGKSDRVGSRNGGRADGDNQRAVKSGTGNNHRIAEDDVLVPGGAAARARANIAAIRLVKELEKEGRPATPAEKKILTQFTGWGSLAQSVFNPDFVLYARLDGRGGGLPPYLAADAVSKYRKWKSQYGQALHPDLGGLLTEKEWAAAEKSTLNAHYTDRRVISAMWEMAEKLGFRGGRVLEPSAGTGLFFGLMPERLAQNSSLAGVELDEMTGKILTYLYPDADIQITGFEKAKRLGDNSVDLVISNVPFGNYPVFDKARPHYGRQSIHNYFFSRALDVVRPGGLVMQITSHYTLDSGSAAKLREAWSRKADLVGAARLPGTAFEKNAGTEVTTDILIFRKKSDSRFELGRPFRNVAPVTTKSGDTVYINEYFAATPVAVLGEHSLNGSMYGGKEYAVLPNKDIPLENELRAFMVELPADVYGADAGNMTAEKSRAGFAAQEGSKEGALVLEDGAPYFVVDGHLETPAWADKKRRREQAQAYVGVKDAALRLISAMNVEPGNERVDALRGELNAVYDAYVKKFGPINKRGNGFLEEDIEFPTVAALEQVTREPVDTVVKSGRNKGERKQILQDRVSKADIFTTRTIFPFQAPEHADGPEDAVKISRIYKNGLDLPYIAGLLGLETSEAKAALLKTGEVFENPESGLLEPRDIYLSGNVREKLARAERAAAENPAYEENAAALRAVQPSRIGIDAIFARLGSAWMPPEVYEAFLRHIGVKNAAVTLTRLPGEEGSASWEVRGSDLSAEARNRWGTQRAGILSLVADCLNLKRSVVLDPVRDGDKTKYVRNDKETLAAQEKQRLLQEEFSAWLVDSEQAALVEDTYNERFNSFVARTFDAPDIKHYPGASHSIELRDNQKVGVSRALQESCLLAHGVGSGKTMLFITLAMEMRRLGTAKKPWIVVQGSTLSQFAASFKALYPAARILAPTETQRNARNRRRLLAQIASGDWDAVITPHGFFNGVSVSPETEAGFIREQAEEYETLLLDIDGNEKRTRKQIEKKIERLKVRLENLAATRKDENIHFDALGVDALLMDEAHAYKRGQFVTKMDNVKGLDRDSSQRSFQMLMKARLVQAKTGGKNVVMATGTPISNTLTEMWTMFRYTRPDLLREFGVEQFDDFATTFATTSVSQEETATGEWKDVERFNKYVNGPELLTLWRSGADVAITEDLTGIKGLPKLKGGKIQEVSVERSEALSNYIEALRQERLAWDALPGAEKQAQSHVPLTIYGRAKQAAIDLRLVDSTLADEPGSKANTAVQNIFERWQEHQETKAAQIVFSNTFQSKDKKFNLFRDIRDKLVERGIPEQEIAVIHDYKTDEARKKLFDAVNRGDVRVLMGTTEKLGVGVNVQERLLTAHHLDAPQRPMDFEQRNGRIRRPGNRFPEVEILTYGTKNTLDSVTFQQLISKQKFINQLLRGNVSDRSFENPFDATQATFEDMLAAFSGNPLAKELMRLTAEVRRLRALRSSHAAQVSGQRNALRFAQAALERRQARLPEEKRLSEYIARAFPGGKIADRKERARQIGAWLEATQAAVSASVADITTQAQWYTKNHASFAKSREVDLGQGLSVTLTVEPHIGFAEEKGEETEYSAVSSYHLQGPHGITQRGEFNGAQGLFTRLENALASLGRAQAIAEARMEETRAQIGALEKEITRPFAQQKELEAAETRLEEVKKELEATTKAKPKDTQEDAAEQASLASLAPGEFLPPRRDTRLRLRQAAVQNVADALGKTARNAAPVRVVRHFEELPAHIRQRHAANAAALEGVYDPGSRVVWLVADNLTDTGRVAEVWAHEQIVHHGLRGLLSDAERKAVLNRLWLNLGGMSNGTIKEIADKYGLNPRADGKARLTVMEEVIASLAEKRQEGGLDAREQSAWRKIVHAVLRAWSRLVHAVSGRSARISYENVDALLADLGRFVMQGAPRGRTAENAAHVSAFASVGKDGEAAGRAAWEQARKDTQAWGRQLDGVRAGSVHSRQVLTVGRTPRVLQKLGAPDLAMTMTQSVLRKIKEGGKHDLPDSLIRNLPALLAEPVMVFKSGTQADSLVALLEAVHEGMPVVAAVHLDVSRGSVNINEIASVYGKSNGGIGWVAGEIQAGRRIYADKTKIPAWLRGFSKDQGSRRMSGLQLPGAFVLPNDPRGIKILTEKDVVKPVAPKGIEEDDAPLASLGKTERVPRAYAESIASGIRRIRKVMGRSVGEDVEEILSNPEMGRLVPKNDLSLLERLFKLPHWIAKEFPPFAKLYDRQQRRSENCMEATNKALAQMPLLFDTDTKKQLGEKEYKQLAAMLNKWDGREIGALKGIEKFNTLGKTLWKDRPVLAHNPRYKEKFDEWLKAQPEPERVKQAFRQVRGALDDAFLAAYSKLAAMSDLADTDLETYRTDFGSIHNYFPHSRKGKYFVTASMGKGVAGDPRQVVFRKHFDVPLGSSVREEWAKIVAANRKDFPGATWNQPQKAEKLPDDILGAPIDVEAMEQLIKAAAGKIGDSEQAQEIQKLMLSGISDILKARGFGAHGIKRQNIPGYETENVKEVLYEYISGLNGWLTKMEAAADFAAALGKIDAQKTPQLWEYASQYVKDMLRNSDQIDRMAGNIKAVAFAWYLGANFKSAVVNATQNAVIGVPRLQMYVTGGGAQWIKGAMDTIGLKYTGAGVRDARNLTADEASMLQELYGNGVINAAYMDELQGQLTSSPVLKGWRRFIAVLGKPMAMVECFNRASLALAAYRAAKAGAFRATALREFGLKDGEKMNHEQARDFAAMLVRDSHYEYGKGNRPEFLRSNFAGRMASPVYTFRSFSFNTLNLWWRALRQEGWEGRAFVAKSLGATIALGGLTAFPFYATLAALCAAASGDDEDWTSKIRKALPESDLLRDVACYGLPALAGVSIGGSLRMETPFTEGIEKGTTFKEAMTESLGALFGIPYDMAVNKTSKFFEAGKYGDGYKMVEALAPAFVANAMQAYRLATEGQTTIKGRPINSPGQTGARKLSGAEAMGKALGFQPTSSAKSYEAYRAGKRQEAVRSDKLNQLTVLALKSFDTGTPDGRIAMMKALRAWNKRMQEEGKPHMLIQPKDVLRRVKSRRRENRATPRQRQKGAAQMATWGV